MAALAVLDVAKSVLEQLSSSAKDELLLWWNSRNELEKLKNTIITIKNVLHDAEQRQATDFAVRRWILRLRDVLYEADDVFDVISTRALRKRVISGCEIVKNIRLFFSRSNHLFFTITIAHKVKDLRQHLDDIADEMNRFHFIISTPVEDERPAMRRRGQSHSYVCEDDVVGREKEKNEILSMLLADADDQEHVSVIAVVGIGGIGKTTLAQLVYNAKETDEQFDLRLWACVNYFSDLNAALEKIIESGTEEKHSSGLQLDQLQNKLRRKINRKKFLLVLDDVCEHRRVLWLPLKVLLDSGERGSKILITTRSMEVAENLATIRPCYALGELSDEHAWSLFKKMAFDFNQADDIQEKEELGRQIVKKCSNVPLAVRTVGSLLYHKDKKQWSKFVVNELMKVIPDRENMIMQVLKISYNDLPAKLKHCFAYFSLIPKGKTFSEFFLTQLWMAQGLLEASSENPCLEQIADDYFFCLLERGIIQVAGIDIFHGQTTIYRMHPLFHDLAVEIAGNEFLRASKIPDDFGERSPRHVCVGEIKDSLFKVKGMRSLLSFGVGYVERARLDALFLNLTSLRSLSLTGLDVEEIPSSIGKLVHLRHLDLRWSEELIVLPASLCKLHNLLTLRLGGCLRLKKLPDDLHKLISLRHLEIEKCNDLNHMPQGLKELTSLVWLDRLVVNKNHATLGCLKHLNNLSGFLHIELPSGQWKNCAADAEESMLRSKKKLRRLSLSWKNSTEGEEMSEADADTVLERLQPVDSIHRLKVGNFPGRKFPEWVSSLKDLVQLDLKNCRKCIKLPPLRQLCLLKRLKLKSLPLVEYFEDICDDSGLFFPSLETLELEDMPRLKGWWRSSTEEGGGDHLLSFTKLYLLDVTGCPELTHLPLCPLLVFLWLDDVNVDLFKELVAKWTTKIEANCNQVSSPPAHQTLQEVSTIRHLSIVDSLNLKLHSVFSALQCLTALERLTLTGFSKTDSSVVIEETIWISLTRLEFLHFEFGNDAQGARLLNGLHHLTSLRQLYIHGDLPGCDIDDSQWTPPPNLKIVGFFEMNEVAPLNRLIRQLQRLPSLMIFEINVSEDELDKLAWEDLKGLTYLQFSCMSMMKRLPDKCQHLPALTELRIEECAEMTSLPNWITRLGSLSISACPELREKCKKPRGSYWPLIQDIPYLYIH